MLVALVVALRTLALICGGNRAVALENLALRQQLAVFKRALRRPQLRHRDRLFWTLFAKAWQDWRTALIVVHPDTVVRWHRQWLRRQWTRRSARGRSGRPSTTATTRTLVMKIAAANPLWGALRIHGELGKLGIEVSERTVSRLVRRPRRPPSQTWRTFLTNHVSALGSMDFFTISSPSPPSRVESCSPSSSCSITAGGSFTSTSRSIRRPAGPRSKSLRRFLMTRRPAGCCAIATGSTARRVGGLDHRYERRAA
jgi:hypothetical protein